MNLYKHIRPHTHTHTHIYIYVIREHISVTHVTIIRVSYNKSAFSIQKFFKVRVYYKTFLYYILYSQWNLMIS